jgi:hypothetical protein
MAKKNNKLDQSLDNFFGPGLFGDLIFLITLGLFQVLVRSGVGLSDWSGKYNASPPGGAPWGDLECHRTWFSITSQLPYEQWYTDTQYSNVTYWPLDYPPLCAYFHSFVAQAKGCTPEFNLTYGFKHQGEKDDHFISDMRNIVIVAEFVLFAPALLFLLKTM